MALLALLLAERTVLARERRRTPLMLLDDVMSELDSDRRELIARELSTGGQSVIATRPRARPRRRCRWGHALRASPGAIPQEALADEDRPRPLSTALQALTATLAPATTLARVQEIWEAAIGPAIASAARPTAERGGVLTVSCDAAVLAQELDLMAGELVLRLNAALGQELIVELRCRTA